MTKIAKVPVHAQLLGLCDPGRPNSIGDIMTCAQSATHSIPASRRFSIPAAVWLASRSATVRRLSSFLNASPAFV